VATEHLFVALLEENNVSQNNELSVNKYFISEISNFLNQEAV